MGLKQFERRLERLVEGAFARAFRSGLQPIEIGRRMVREMEAGRTLGVRGTIVPNDFDVRVSAEDRASFQGYEDALLGELAEAARAHAKEEGEHFLGPVEARFVTDHRRRAGSFAVEARIVEGEAGWASLVLPDGTRVSLTEEAAVIGRHPGCAVPLSDSQVSRHHAEVRPGRDGYVVRDLGSTNGTRVNGAVVAERALADGDEISVGNTTLRFEET